MFKKKKKFVALYITTNQQKILLSNVQEFSKFFTLDDEERAKKPNYLISKIAKYKMFV